MKTPKVLCSNFAKLGLLRKYQTEFESLANRIIGLPTEFYLSCFISGLKPEIRREVQAFQPISLSHAISLAKLHEEKHNDRPTPLFNRRPETSSSQTSLQRPTPRPLLTSTPTTTPLPTKTPPPIRKLSPAELQARRKKGLCYNCDDKYSPGHRCKRQFHLLVAIPETIEIPDDPITHMLLSSQTQDSPDTNPPSPPSETHPAQISLHALMGHSIPQTLRVLGHIAKNPVAVLIDGGSTNNFIQDRVAKQLGLALEPAHSFQVLVGNGEELQCSSICPNVCLRLGSHDFCVDLFVVPLCGAEIVLGVQWLRSLGPVLTNYDTLTMSFLQNGQIIHITGESKPHPKEASLHQLKRMVSTHAVDTFFHLHIIPSTPEQNDQPLTIPWLESLLQTFAHLFTEPLDPPPTRTTDHHIPLLSGSDPVNVRPYRYPHFQMQEIENQVKEMLSKGHIQPSSSAFSSPVLLVRKKDGTWRFCVDYRALNAITVKDRFPIPAIDELLDELYGTKWFSKLDLRSGFHQIRMHPPDIPKTAFRTHQGHYEYLVMPFGLCNAPSTFQATTNLLFQPYLHRFVIVFFDDILVYSSSLEDHHTHLQIVFQCLVDNHFFLKKSKCTFAQPSISYLGHIVSANGVGPDQEKIKAMVQWPQPQTLKQLRGFLGLTGFYRKFVHNYAQLLQPPSQLC